MDLKSDSLTKLGEQDVTTGKNRAQTDPSSKVSSTAISVSNSKTDVANTHGLANSGVYYSPSTCYSYYYPGYDGTYSECEDQGYMFAGDGSDMSYTGIPSSNGSMVYYVPGYNAYTPGTLMSSDGQLVGQQYFLSNGTDAMPSHSYDSSAAIGGSTNQIASVGPRLNGAATVHAAPFKPKNSNAVKTNNQKDSTVTTPVQQSKSQSSTASRGFSVTAPHFEPLHKQGSAFQSTGMTKGYCYPTPFSSFSNQWHGGFYPQHGYPSYVPRGRQWNGNDRSKGSDKMNRNSEFDASSELTRGPRAYARRNSSKTAEKNLNSSLKREQYNLPDFETIYDQAMFFVIKSFSEDDVHKSIKYNVWASTPGGNKKLDTAFQDAEARCLEKGTKCPIFLFFSVNGSGQFVGLAEMIGKVDFKKTMDFWQQDKWTGFFPLKWHIIKDVSNNQLRHIILENNDNKPVTNSRDTQEVKFKQGSEMLSIFKNHSAETSLLDDFPFYEDREKSFQAKKGNKRSQSHSETRHDTENNLLMNLEPEMATKSRINSSNTKQSVATLTQNLSTLSVNTNRNNLTVP